MSAESYAFLKTWAVGAYRVTLTVPKPKPGQVMSAVVEWKPQPPAPASLSIEDINEYRRGRNAALRTLSQQLGIRVAVVDI